MEKWNERIKKWVTPKRVAVMLTAVYVASLIPLLWIAWYNYPSADDYSIGSQSHQAWVGSHSLFRVLGAGIARAVDDWCNWMGYFTSNFLMAIPPSTFGERAYVLTTWIMLGMLSLSTMYLLYAVFVKVLKGDKLISHSISMIMLFITVQCMVGRVEAFYWYSGAVNYIFVHGMSLFFYGLLIGCACDKGKKRIWELVLASVLGFFVGGGNQMTALNAAVVMLAAIGFLIFLRKQKKYKSLFIPIGVFYLGFILNVAAPGNWVRAADATGMNPIKAVLVSFYYCLDYCLSEWSGWSVLVMVIVLIPLFWHLTQNTKFQFHCPLIVVLFGYCLVSAMMTPPLFAVGSIEAGRLQALTFTMYILVLTLCVGYVTGWVRKKMEARGSLYQNQQFASWQIWCLLGCILFLTAGSVLTVIPDSDYFTWSCALTDILNGSAKEYGDALAQRAELYHSGSSEVEVEKLPVQPQLLYFSDIKSDPNDWENRGLCRFYGLKSVVVKE